MPFDRDDSDFDEVPPDNLAPKNGRTVGDGTTAADHDTVTSESVDTKKVANSYLYAGGFDGSTPDERLDNALAEATDGQLVYLEEGTYSDSRTITERISLIGVVNQGTVFSADLTFSSPDGHLERIDFDFGTSSTLTLASFLTTTLISNATVQVTGDSVGVFNSRKVDVTFQSGTKDGMADGLLSGSTVTDNGTNTVGDIA